MEPQRPNETIGSKAVTAENWEGTWLTDRGFLVKIEENKVVDVDSSIPIYEDYKISTEGVTSWGKLMHRRRGDEDLRTKWKK